MARLKIVASTDPRLNNCIHCQGTGELVNIPYTSKCTDCKLVPQIHQSFIEEYCNAGGIGEVLVEVGHRDIKWRKSDKPNISKELWAVDFGPKLNPDSTIIIHPVEERIVDKKALDICQRIVSYMDASPELKETTMIEIYHKANKWIEENL